MSKTPRYLETPPDWTPEEQPTLRFASSDCAFCT